jgi:hypothetical protein
MGHELANPDAQLTTDKREREFIFFFELLCWNIQTQQEGVEISFCFFLGLIFKKSKRYAGF